MSTRVTRPANPTSSKVDESWALPFRLTWAFGGETYDGGTTSVRQEEMQHWSGRARVPLH